MKKLQEEESLSIRDSLGVEPKSFHNFPGYRFMGGTAGFEWKRHRIAVRASFLTTGSRIQYSDYSGNVEANKILSTIPVSLGYEWTPLPRWPVRPFVGLHFGLTSSLVKTNSAYAMYSDKLSEKRSFQGKVSQAFVEPSARIEFTPIKYVILGMSVGKFIHIRSEDLTDDQTNAALETPVTNAKVRPEWNGLRLAVFAGLRIGLKK